MAKQATNTIKQWFRTGLKPKQEQFWDWLDSFRHKDDKIPAADIEGMDALLLSKADKAVLDDHLINDTAHGSLFGAKEDKNKKGVANGYAPLDAFTKLASQYLNIVNDLVTGGTTSLLSAEQGKLLQAQVTAINTLLASDNVNLDNVQEIVDAIETVQASLSTILVNDLTTGGTTKALTAEMGKTLKGLIDTLTTIVSGKQDISNQIEVSASTYILDSWHGKTVLFTASCTVTVPASFVNAGTTFEGKTFTGVTITWAITSPKTWLEGTPSATTEKQIFTFMQRNGTNSIMLLGV
jgi:hypothetical protein